MRIRVVVSLVVLFLSSVAFCDQVGCILSKEQVETAINPINSGKPVEYFDRSKVATPEVRASWAPEMFTDPKNHNSENYRYILHTIDNFGISYSAHSSYDFISKTAENPCSSISATLVSSEKRKTFGTLGFILSVPAENILFSGPKDLSSFVLNSNQDPVMFNSALNQFFKDYEKGPFLTPDQLLKVTDPSSYNEVLIQNKFIESVKVSAVFMVDNPSTAYGSPEKRDALIEEMKVLAQERNIPFLHFKAP